MTTTQDTPEPSPLAFVTATGFVFQIVGLILAFGGCCLWSLSGKFEAPQATPVDEMADYVASTAVQLNTTSMVGLVVTFVAGIGLLATGMGLQGEHPSSGRTAMAVSGALAVAWWACAIAFGVIGGAYGRLLLAVLLAVGATLLFLLAGNSARLLRLHPPPADRSVVTDEFLEEQRQRRKS